MSVPDLHRYRSEMTFEQLNDLYKGADPEHRVLLTMYHWALPGEMPLIADLDAHQAFYVCDSSACWNTVKHLPMELYEVQCVIQYPVFLMEQWEIYPNIKRLAEPKDMATKRGSSFREGIVNRLGYLPECLILTPHPQLGEDELRELILMKPREQILRITKLGDFVPAVRAR